ncbi:MAG TPA: Calx-beta domain-containing protein, partial [Blastocatellia bacterium]|nr:Calx-beta domain-containing protein [Blastocatellia bacterium]
FAASPTSLNSAELYDSATGTWSLTANLNTVRDSHTATLLGNGKVLVVGGDYWTTDGNTPNDGTYPCGVTLTCSPKALNAAELYDVATRTWSVTASLNTPRLQHTATLLANGKILVAGGCNFSGFNCSPFNSAELFEQDLSPSISISDSTVTEGNSGTVNVTFQVNLSAPSSQPVSVTFSTGNRTANAGTDFVGTSGTLTFDPGETTKTITVVVDGNDTLELNKSFVVNLTSATNAFIADGQGVGTIVNDDGPLPQMLANISSRGGVLTGNNVMIGGFIIDGTAPKRVLVRSRGPSMAGAPFFVPGTLANPMVQLFSGPTLIAQNDNWQDAPNCPGFVCEGATEILNTGLDPCTPNPGQSSSPANCALEAAILITLPPGPYTAIVNGVAGGTGVGLVEVFEADASTVSDLGNISTRGFVQSGDDVMIGGLIIEGSSPATVLIRARGPSMSGAPFFVPGTLANPFLQIFSGQDVIAQNDNWQDAPSCNGFVCGTAAQIAATGLDPCQPNPGESTPPVACTQESAVLITLPPGPYTAIVSGVGGGTGVGLVEAFEMD